MKKRASKKKYPAHGDEPPVRHAYPVLEAPTPHYNTNEEIKLLLDLYGSKIIEDVNKDDPPLSFSELQYRLQATCERINMLAAQLRMKSQAR